MADASLCLQVIPLLSVLEDIVQRRIRGGVHAACLPKGARLVWTSREREEFTLISESIMAAARYATTSLTLARVLDPAGICDAKLSVFL